MAEQKKNARHEISKKSHFLDGCLFLDSQFAAVITAFSAYGVIDVPSTAVGTYDHSGGNSLIVGSSFGCSRWR